MKKIILITIALLLSFNAISQERKERTIQLYYGGEVLYSRAVSMLDSLNFRWKIISDLEDEDDKDDVLIEGNDSIYIGVVAFNGNVDEYPITNNLEGVKSFINSRKNNNDKTAFAYAVSKGNEMFDETYLPTFDKIFMLNFSDGTDNESNAKWGDEGRRVPSAFVYDTARYDLSKREQLNSYALGFGASEANFREKMRKVVLGSGDYYRATTSNDLQGAFNEVAKSIIASSKNVLLRTSRGYFDEEYPKYFRLKFEANGYKDSLDAKMVGTPQEGYEMQIIREYNKYVTFNNPTYGNVNAETGKVHIPLNNLKFIVNGEELQFDFEVYVSNDNVYYYYDVEDASKSESISKRIAVVLVLDCSTSMGEAFEPMKEAAVDFIETLENMDPNANSETIISGTANGYAYVDLGLPSGTKWATMNLGATSPEGYGNYYAWGETTTKSSYTLDNYKWYDADKGEYIKPNSAVNRSATISNFLKSSANYQYYLNGTLPGTDWDFGYGFNGTATIFCESGINYEFKITEGASWNVQFGFYNLASVPDGVSETGAYGGNIGFSLPQDGYVTISILDGLITLSSSVGFGSFVQPEPTGEYYIAGGGEGDFACGVNWDPSACPMANGTVTYTALPAGDYSFKITDGTWNNSWGRAQLADPTAYPENIDNNVIFTLDSASDVTISFDGTTLSLTIVQPEPTGEYYIAGKGEGDFACGVEWNPSACPMANGTVTYTALPAGDYAFVITDGTWNNIWGRAQLADPTAYPEDNDNVVIFTLDSASDVTISFDGTTLSLTINGEGGSDEGGSDEGNDDPIDVPTFGYSIQINGTTLVALTDEGPWDMDPSYTQYSLKGIPLKAGDTFVFYTNGTGDTWGNIAIDVASVTEIIGNGDNFSVSEDGCYSVYLKLKYMEDNVYFGVGNCNSTLSNLELTDDAAYVNWGSSWRMPTKEEQDELRTECTWKWTSQNGVNGYKVTSKTNGNSIFLPATGYRNNSSLNLTGSYGGYWTSSPSDESSSANLLYFGTNNDININNSYRYYGQSVRAVLR